MSLTPSDSSNLCADGFASDTRFFDHASAGNIGPDEPYPYETADFHQVWWACLASRFDIPVKNRDLLIHRKRLLKGLFTLREARIAGWNAAWSQDLTEARLAELEELSRIAPWDYCRLTWNESRAGLQALDRMDQLNRLAGQGYRIFQTPAPSQHVIDLDDGFEGWLQSLSHNGRKGLKKKVRRAEPLRPQRIVLTGEADIEPFFEAFFPLHRAYWDAKADGSYLNHPEERRFILEWAKALHRSGHLVLDRVFMDGEPVNLSMGLRMGRTFYWLLTINTGAHAEAGPGLVGLYLRARDLAEEGVTRFNMGAGDYFYKVQSANSREACRDLIIVNPASRRGKIWLAWLKRRHAHCE
jgi:hypothetical protein